MNAQQTLSQQLALFLYAPLLGTQHEELPRQSPPDSGRRGEILLEAARGVADSMTEAVDTHSPAETRLMRNKLARKAAEALDHLVARHSSDLQRADTARIRDVANALSLGWEEVEQFLKR